MWLMLCWLVGLPKLLYHFVLTLPVLILYLFYKISGSLASSSSPSIGGVWRPIASQRPQLASQLQQQLVRQLIDKMRPVTIRADRRPPPSPLAANHHYLAGVLLVGLLCVSTLPMGSDCLEQDGEILKPLASLAKSVIKTVTLGEPLQMNFDLTGLAKNFAYFTWRTGFPVSMPKGFVQKAQDFYNRVKLRVDQADVKDVERKSLAGLKVDLDEIVDSIVEEVRQSPDGLYTDYLQTRVRGIPLEDACTAVGVQLKAYGVDLTNYRNIAGMVLGIPVMPTVASTMINVANLASLDAMRNLTHSFGQPLNSTGLFLAQLPGNALNSVSSVSNSALSSINTLGQQLPVRNLVQTPLNLFSQQPALA